MEQNVIKVSTADKLGYHANYICSTRKGFMWTGMRDYDGRKLRVLVEFNRNKCLAWLRFDTIIDGKTFSRSFTIDTNLPVEDWTAHANQFMKDAEQEAAKNK